MSCKAFMAVGLSLLSLTGCVTPPPTDIANGPLPLVAVPGPTKSAAEFNADDTHCRAQAVQLPRGSGSPSAAPSANPGGPFPSGVAYLRCMASAHNSIQPYEPVQPVFTYYEPYPVYVGVGYGYPWFYGYGVSSFGFYSGRFGYYRGYHEGFRESGFHGRYGGGFHEGGFHGGGVRDGVFHGGGRR